MKSKGFILSYLIIWVTLIGLILSILIYFNNSVNKKYLLINYELYVKSKLEGQVTGMVSSSRLSNLMSEEYVFYSNFYLCRVEKYDDKSNIIYCKLLEYPKLVYYQIYENQYTKYNNDQYVIREEGYLWEE